MSDEALNTARALAAGLDPMAAAARCGADYAGDASGGRFLLPLLGTSEAIRFPEFEFADDSTLPPHLRALLVYYLATSDGAKPTGDWHSFADLPNGRFYVRAFQGYTGDALTRRLGERAAALPDAIAALGGRALAPEELATNADAAWMVPALPRVPIAIVWWYADDEFPARAELLFDATASRHLPTDGCAILGSWLTTRLIGEVEKRRS